jgi:hypothetical protein
LINRNGSSAHAAPLGFDAIVLSICVVKGSYADMVTEFAMIMISRIQQHRYLYIDRLLRVWVHLLDFRDADHAVRRN